jgi:hypothetical protein
MALVGVMLPAFAPHLVSPWTATRPELALAAFAAVLAHTLLHGVLPDRPVLPGVAVTVAAAAVLAVAPPLRAHAYAALVANASASAPDLWDAVAVTAGRRLAPPRS